MGVGETAVSGGLSTPRSRVQALNPAKTAKVAPAAIVAMGLSHTELVVVGVGMTGSTRSGVRLLVVEGCGRPTATVAIRDAGSG